MGIDRMPTMPPPPAQEPEKKKVEEPIPERDAFTATPQTGEIKGEVPAGNRPEGEVQLEDANRKMELLERKEWEAESLIVDVEIMSAGTREQYEASIAMRDRFDELFEIRREAAVFSIAIANAEQEFDLKDLSSLEARAAKKRFDYIKSRFEGLNEAMMRTWQVAQDAYKNKGESSGEIDKKLYKDNEQEELFQRGVDGPTEFDDLGLDEARAREMYLQLNQASEDDFHLGERLEREGNVKEANGAYDRSRQAHDRKFILDGFRRKNGWV